MCSQRKGISAPHSIALRFTKAQLSWPRSHPLWQEDTTMPKPTTTQEPDADAKAQEEIVQRDKACNPQKTGSHEGQARRHRGNSRPEYHPIPLDSARDR